MGKDLEGGCISLFPVHSLNIPEEAQESQGIYQDIRKAGRV
jgi:hypothetical protein